MVHKDPVDPAPNYHQKCQCLPPLLAAPLCFPVAAAELWVPGNAKVQCA